MFLLSIAVSEFESITLEDCINYIQNNQLETCIKYSVEKAIKTLNAGNSSNLSKEDKIQRFLEYVLLRMSSSSLWINFKDKDNLTQKDIYTIIKKYIYLNHPSLLA